MMFVDRDSVFSLLPMEDCIDLMEIALSDYSAGDVTGPDRSKHALGESNSELLVMLASSRKLSAYAAKLITLHGENASRSLPTIQGLVIVFDYETGQTVGIVEASAVTYLRTAAASGLATRCLSRKDAHSHGIFGTGVQAEAHLIAIGCVREIKEVLIWARKIESAEKFVAANKDKTRARLIAVEDPREAASCDIVSCATGTSDPLLAGEWIRKGTHINLVGSHTPSAREADTDAVMSATVFVDSSVAANREAGDLIIAARDAGVAIPHRFTELGNVVSGRVQGRKSADENTMFKSVGIAATDLYTAKFVVDRAVALAQGKEINSETK